MPKFSDPTSQSITVPNTEQGVATLFTLAADQACLKVFGSPPGSEDFSNGLWVVDYSNDGTVYVPVRDSEITGPTVIQLPLPAAFCRLRCVIPPQEIAKTPLAVLCLR